MGFSETLSFVKKYPITLCGFSLLFMPSVHQLLLYFTPLLLSTGIFVVAMLTSANPSNNNTTSYSHHDDDDDEHNVDAETFGFVEEDAGRSHGWGAHLEREPQFSMAISTAHRLPRPRKARLAHKCAEAKQETHECEMLSAQSEPDPDLCEQPLAWAEPDPDLCEQPLARSEPDPDLCEQPLVRSEPDPDLCEQPLARSEPDPDLCEKPLARSEPDPDLCEQPLARSEPDPDLCEQPLARSEPDPDLCEQPLARSEPDPDLCEQPLAKSEPDPDLCEKPLASVEPELYVEPVLVDEAPLVNERHVEVDNVEKALARNAGEACPNDVQMLLAASRRLSMEQHHDNPPSLCLVNNTFSQPLRTLQVAL